MHIQKIFAYIWILFSFVLFHDNHVNGDCFGERCGDCLLSGIQCLWCKKLNFTESRCSKENDHVLNNCTGSDIVRQPSSSFKFDKNEQLRDGNFLQQPIQIQPQEITFKLVPNTPYKLDFKYKVAKNFPVDIYFLVDPSYTMRTLREQLANLTTDIANSIAELTTDYRFGYGTSMDKVVTPFTHISPAYLQNPCSGDSVTTCAPPHSFIHRLNLTSDVTAFKRAVETTHQTANRDRTEGMFDGVMQASVCTEAIGWRSNARRIMLYASDSDYHFAGDGKLAGIVRKHDMKCHLAPFGNHMKYTHDAILDYPSVGQIRKVLSDNNINIIFFIGGNKAKRYYETLKIPGSFTEEFQTESKNILSIIRNTYEILRGTVKFVNDPFQNIDIEYRTTCNGKQVYGPRDTCQSINVIDGEEISFEAWLTLKITKCPVNANDRIQRGSIYPEGLADKLNLNIEHVCDCDCQSPLSAEENATYCNGHGRLECGACNCYNGFTVQYCATTITPKGCEFGIIWFNGESVICGNIGSCNFDRCECPLGFSGQFCQCSNSSCGGYIRTAVLCNGNGLCECGECLCHPGFTGKTCECTTSTKSCTSPSSTSSTNLCSGHGTCECGRCICDKDYNGSHCEECLTCRPCLENKDCAACYAFQTGFVSEECKQRCPRVKVTSELNENSTQCMYIDSDGCFVTYSVDGFAGVNVTVAVKESRGNTSDKSTLDCPREQLLDNSYLSMIICGSVVIVVCFVVLALKIVTSLIDNREYKKYEKHIIPFEILQMVTSSVRSIPPRVHRVNEHQHRRDSTESVIESSIGTSGYPGFAVEHHSNHDLLSPSIHNHSNLVEGRERSRYDNLETNSICNRNKHTMSQDETNTTRGNIEVTAASITDRSGVNRKTRKLPPIEMHPLNKINEPQDEKEELLREKKKKKRKKKRERRKKRLLEKSQNVVNPI